MSIDQIFSHVIAAHSLTSLDAIGILDFIRKQNKVSKKDIIRNFPKMQIPGMEAALISLTYAGIMKYEKQLFSYTKKGLEIVSDLGALNLWLKAYSRVFPKIESIIRGQNTLQNHDIDAEGVAVASAEIGSTKIDPYLHKLLNEINFDGKVCDLGCGSGKRISYICQLLGKDGMGVDISKNAINFAKGHYKKAGEDNQVDFLCQDVTQMNGVYPDVGLLMQTFMTHHILPDEHCVNVLDSYITTFPNVEYFLILDTMWPESFSNTYQNFTSGFLLMHGLQNIVPRSKVDMKRILEKSKFSVLREISLDVADSYIWLLVPSSAD